MIEISWRPYYELGIESIDQDHQQLLSIMQDIQESIKNRDLKTATQLFDVLITETTRHFEHEEAMLDEAGFPHLARHRQYHADLMKDVLKTRHICEKADSETTPGECFDNMARLIIDDILRGDLGFKSFMEDAGYIKPSVRIPT